MTNGAAAALALSSRMLGGRMDWSSAFASWSPHELSGVLTAMQSNLEVGFNLTKGWITPAARTGRRSPDEDKGGVVSGPPWHLEARCRVDGTEHRVFTGMPAPRRNRELERRRQGMGMPAARLAVRTGWHAARRTGHP